jgi:hypothetical protein
MPYSFITQPHVNAQSHYGSIRFTLGEHRRKPQYVFP